MKWIIAARNCDISHLASCTGVLLNKKNAMEQQIVLC